VFESNTNRLACGLNPSQTLDASHEVRVEDYIRALAGFRWSVLQVEFLYTFNVYKVYHKNMRLLSIHECALSQTSTA
jgi:hypothetical protein